MKKEQERLYDKNILGDEVSGSRREFLKSVGQYSMAVVGSMALAGTLVSVREAEAAEGATRKKASSSSAQPRQQMPAAGLKPGQVKSTPKLKSKFDDPASLKGFNPLPTCW
jgi:hypothetical protein